MIIPTPIPHQTRWQTEHQLLLLTLEPAYFAQMAAVASEERYVGNALFGEQAANF